MDVFLLMALARDDDLRRGLKSLRTVVVDYRVAVQEYAIESRRIRTVTVVAKLVREEDRMDAQGNVMRAVDVSFVLV